MSTNPRWRRVTQALEKPSGSDDSGAVLILGLFLCTCVVGLLWYLAGIGDAIILRERMQEASDAAALSSAMLQARGMNLIVLLNLIMACVLGVRVALKTVELALLIAGSMFSGAPATWGVAAACYSAAEYVDNVVDTTREPINDTIKVLGKVQVGISVVSPLAAVASSARVGRHYRPEVKDTLAANALAITGLPVEEGTSDHLCSEAGRAMPLLLAEVVRVPIPRRASSKVSSLIDRAMQMGGSYFCELEGKSGTAGSGATLERVVQAGCDEVLSQLEDKWRSAERAYSSACNRFGSKCTGVDSAGQVLSKTTNGTLPGLTAARDAARSAVANFNRKACEQQRQLEAISPASGQGGQSLKPSTSAAQQAMTPKRVRTDWTNGGSNAQLWAVAKGQVENITLARRGIRVAAWSRENAATLPSLAGIAFSQAELFFDCEGEWQGEDCNGSSDEAAMWRMRWRTRLRRADSLSENPVVSRLAGLAIGASAVQEVYGWLGTPPAGVPNRRLLSEVTQAARTPIVH